MRTLRQKIKSTSWYNDILKTRDILLDIEEALASDAPQDTNQYARQDGEWQEVDLKNSYSTAETPTGGTWIDGKPIYSRTFVGTTSAPTIIKTDYNMETIVTEPDGRFIITGGNSYPLNYFDGSIGSWSRVNEATQTFVFVLFNFGGSVVVPFNSFYVTIQYTKTTD